MLKDIIDKRYSVKYYLDTPVEQEKIDYVVDCAMNAPSKQAVYPYEIFVLGSSEKANELKEEFFYEYSWCLRGRLSTLLTSEQRQNMNVRDVHLNGQYKAPVLLLWVERDPDENHDNAVHANSLKHSTYSEKKIMDITVSASFGMLAAEEQGLNTCFAKCHNEKLLAEKLGRPGRRAELGLGFGYAAPDNVGDDPGDQGQARVVDKEGAPFGLLPKNLDQNFRWDWHYQRQFRPDRSKLIHIV